MKLAEAYVEVKSNQAAFSKELKTMESSVKTSTNRMQQKLQTLAPTFRKVGIGMAALGGAIVAAGVLSIKTYSKMGDEVAKMAKRTGFSTEALSELRHAAEISGAGLGSLEKGVKRMSGTILDAQDGMETYLRSFRHIGIEVEELEGLKPEEQFMKIAMAIAELEDPTKRAAIAQDIFGRAGTELLPLFAEGAEGIAKLREEAHDLGIVFDQEAAKKAEDMTDAMHRVGEATSGLKIAIADALIPVLMPLVDKVKEIITGVKDWMKAHPGLSSAIVKFGVVLAPLLIALGSLLIFLPSLISLAPLVGAAFHTMLGPVGLITAAIAGAVAAFLYFYKTSDKFRNFIDKIVAYVKAFVQNAWNRLVWLKDNWGALWKTVFEAIPKIAKTGFDNLVAVFKSVWDFIKGWGSWLGENFINVWKNMFGAISTAVKTFGENIWAQLKWVGEKMKPQNWFKKIEKPEWKPLLGDFEAVWAEMPVIAELQLKKITEGVKTYFEPLPELVKPIYKVLKEEGEKIVEEEKKQIGEVIKAQEEKTDKVVELTEEEKKQIEERLAAEKGLLQEIFELTRSKDEVAQKAFDERIARLRELGVEEELIEKLIAARNAVIQEQITEKEAEEAEKRRVIAEKEAEEKAKAAEAAAERRITAEEQVSQRIFELTHTREEIDQAAFDAEIKRFEELGVSDELIQQLITVRHAKIQEEITAKEAEEADKRLKESEKEAEEKKRLAEEAAQVRMRLEEEVTQKVFEFVHTREEIEQRAFDSYISNLREKGVNEEAIAALIEAREAKLQEEITNKEKEEAEKREKIAEDEQEEKVRLAQEATDKRIAAEQKVTDKIFELTHTREEIDQQQFNREIERLQELGVSNKLIQELIAARRAKIQEEITAKEKEEADKRLKEDEAEADEKVRLAEEAAKIRISLEEEVTQKIFELTRDREEIEQKAFDDYIARLREKEVDEELIGELIAARHAKLEEEKTAKEEEEAEKREQIAKDEEEKKAEEHKEALEKREAAELSFAETMAKLRGDETALLEIEIEKRIEQYQKEGWTEVEIQTWVAEFRKQKEEEVTQKIRDELEERFIDWQGYFEGIKDLSLTSIDDFVAYWESLSDEEKKNLEDSYDRWEEYGENIKTINEGILSSIKSGWETLFKDLIKGTKTLGEAFQALGQTILDSFIDAFAKSLVEKMGFDKLFEGNILNLGNLFTGLGNLITGVFKGIGNIAKSVFDGIGESTTKLGGIFGTLINMATVFGQTIKGLISVGGPLMILVGIMKLLTGGEFFAGFEREVREEAEKRAKWKREQESAIQIWQREMRAKGFLTGPYGVMYHPETREAYEWRGGAEGGPVAVPYPFKEGAVFLEGLRLFQKGAVFTKPTVFRGIAGEGGETEILTPENLIRRVVREEAGRDGGGGIKIGTISLLLPSVRTAEDLERMSPAAWKRVFDKGLIRGMKMSAKEGKFSKEALMMD